MTAILLFLLILACLGTWWLLRQGVMSKPWLETGVDTIQPGSDRMSPHLAKIGLGVFLGVVGSLFALFLSAYFIRMAYADWRPVPLPQAVWISTGQLIVSSVLLQIAVIAARKGDRTAIKLSLLFGAVATLGFLISQLMAFSELSSTGYALTKNPANSFFFMITGAHGLHILGGLIALGLLIADAWNDGPFERLILKSELCATYWHFLLLIWVVILIVLIGWADSFIAFCGQFLP
ncbi:MAG: cytochrome c oxidase subunit 3 [Boseongicola sp.]